MRAYLRKQSLGSKIIGLLQIIFGKFCRSLKAGLQQASAPLIWPGNSPVWPWSIRVCANLSMHAQRIAVRQKAAFHWNKRLEISGVDR